MQALRIYAGPLARQHIEKNGFQPGDVGTVPGAAGGPKGLILGRLDQYIFGHWLAQTRHEIHLVGASIGAWRMATACLDAPAASTGSGAPPDPAAAFKRLEHDYIHQHYELQPGQTRPTPHYISARFGQGLRDFYAGRVDEVLHHPRFKLHIITSRGRHILRTEHALRSRLGYLGAYLTNSLHRKSMGAWLERVVFSTQKAPLPFATSDYRTRQVALTQANFMDALQASCSIPFLLNSVHNIAGAPPGAYWDGGITDYHLHLNYINTTELIANNVYGTLATGINSSHIAAAAPGAGVGLQLAAGEAAQASPPPARASLVLYPHFQKAVVPGWLDKGLKWRHKSTHCLDNVLLVAPDPDWVKTLPNGKLPDRQDFTHYGNDLAGRVKAWRTAASASQQLADEFAVWLDQPDVRRVQPL